MLRFVNFGVDFVGAEQLLVSAYGVNLAVVKNDYFVCVLNGAYALSNDYCCDISVAAFEAFADFSVGCGVNGARAVVKNKHLGRFEQGSCDAKPLLLAAGKIYAALPEIGLIAVGERCDKFVSLCNLAGIFYLLGCGVGIAPAQVILNRARKQQIDLEHHGNGIAQIFKSETGLPPTLTTPSVTS